MITIYLDMKKLETSIKKLLRDLGIEKQVLQYQVIADWPSIVGQRIAEVTKAEKIENQVLFIKVNHSTWRNELHYQKADIIEKINKRIGQKIVIDIKFY